MNENNQSYIVEYEIGQESFYAHVIAGTQADAINEFNKMKIKDALFPVYEPLGRVLNNEEFEAKITAKKNKPDTNLFKNF